MKRNLTFRETITVTSMLFGMFFGAGNLIFPAKLGIDAGSNMLIAFVGVLVTAVGFPMLAVVALGLTRSEGVAPLASRISPRYSLFFCTLLYLTIGPLFAIPRCASTAFSVGAVNLLPQENQSLSLLIFSALFFIVVLIFSLKPSGIMTWIGVFLNPLFLGLLLILVVAALLSPTGNFTQVTPTAAYSTTAKALTQGFLDGYNTMDALAGLAFGIVVIRVVRDHGVTEPDRVAVSTAKAGIFSCLFMGIIYFFVTLTSAQSYPICGTADNGSTVLGLMAHHYFRSAGAIIITAIVTLACLKTAIGLVTSCSEAFVQLFPKGPGYTVWAVLFSAAAFGIANFGLSTIVARCIPVLMFLYPLAITLILLALTGKFFGHDRSVYRFTTALTLVTSVFYFLSSLSDILPNVAFLSAVSRFAHKVFPLFSLGLGWIAPALIGAGIGLIVRKKSS